MQSPWNMASRHGARSCSAHQRPAGRMMMRSRLTLERELRDLLGTGRNARIAARYFGCDGQGGGTFQYRQIVTAASERLSTRRPALPTLNRPIAFVVDRMRAPAEEVEAQLRSHQLPSGPSSAVFDDRGKKVTGWGVNRRTFYWVSRQSFQGTHVACTD